MSLLLNRGHTHIKMNGVGEGNSKERKDRNLQRFIHMEMLGTLHLLEIHESKWV